MKIGQYAVATIAIAIVLLGMMYSIRIQREYFVDSSFSIEEDIIRTYQQLLQRDPTADEVKSIRTDIEKRGLNFYTLRQMIIDTDEYQRMTKVQSNTVAPELIKMLADREQIDRINGIYEEILKRKMKSELALPYHDLYVHIFKNNDLLLRRMFLNENYGSFEYEVLHTIALDRDKLFSLYERMYGKIEVPVPVWWPSVPLDAGTKRDRFVTPDGKEIWYPPLASDQPPTSDYMVSPTSLTNSAGYWEENDATLGMGIAYPWREPKQEEVTYTLYDDTTIVSPAIEVTSPTYPSTQALPAITVQSSLPQPSLPLQNTPVFSSLGTTVLMIEQPAPPASPPSSHTLISASTPSPASTTGGSSSTPAEVSSLAPFLAITP